MMKLRRAFDSVERTDIVEKSQQCLWSDDGKPGLDYLLGQRQLSELILKAFRVGYVPKNVNHQLRGRIILPLFDPSKHLVVVASRMIDDSENPLPVYWHESYKKSFFLYGAPNAIPYMRKWKFATVVEGQFDVMQMHNHGFRNTVGLCSHDISAIQFAVLQRYCEEIILVLDQDDNQAGQKGIKKAMDEMKPYCGFDGFLPLPEYRNKFSYVEFPENTDPDSFLRKHGVTALKQMIDAKLRELRKNTYDRQST
jgi:DNA primase